MNRIPSRTGAADVAVTRRAPLEDAAPVRRATLEDLAPQRRGDERLALRDDAGALRDVKCANCNGRGHRWWEGCPQQLKPALAAEAAAKARAKAPAVAKGKAKSAADGARDGRRTRPRF